VGWACARAPKKYKKNANTHSLSIFFLSFFFHSAGGGASAGAYAGEDGEYWGDVAA
jgi:hypothetical protein